MNSSTNGYYFLCITITYIVKIISVAPPQNDSANYNSYNILAKASDACICTILSVKLRLRLHGLVNSFETSITLRPASSTSRHDAVCTFFVDRSNEGNFLDNSIDGRETIVDGRDDSRQERDDSRQERDDRRLTGKQSNTTVINI